MLGVLANREYAKLFAAQAVALVGTGLLTVALGLLAFDAAGADAGMVLGTALTIKMVAYVAVSPLMDAAMARLPRKPVLIGANLIRAAAALCLPFIGEVWHIYVLVAILQSASATFTPAFQAVIPDVVPGEREYTRALSLSRLAYDLESLVSPVIAAALLTVMTYGNLFVGTFAGFTVATCLVSWTALPPRAGAEATFDGTATSVRDASAGFLDRLTAGARIFARNPELRGLAAMNLVVAASTAMVIVDTVVLVRGGLGRGESDVAVLLAAYGAGSMVVALGVPKLLDAVPDRPVMFAGAALAPVGLVVTAWLIAGAGSGAGPEPVWLWPGLMAAWLTMGAAASLVLTPSARLLRRASTAVNRSAVFAAQFSLSHACFLLTYPLAGFLGARIGVPATALILAGIGVSGVIAAAAGWRGPGSRVTRATE